MACIRELKGKMSTQSSLMYLPQEVLVMILNIYFSNTTIKIRRCLRRSRRNASNDCQPSSLACKCMNVLLVNKALRTVAMPCFYNNVTVWSNAMFNEQQPYSLSWINAEVPWSQITSVSGNQLFANLFRDVLVHREIPIPRLRNINVHNTLVIHQARPWT